MSDHDPDSLLTQGTESTMQEMEMGSGTPLFTEVLNPYIISMIIRNSDGRYARVGAQVCVIVGRSYRYQPQSLDSEK